VSAPVQVVNVSELPVHSHFGDSKLPVYRQINSKVSAPLGRKAQLRDRDFIVIQGSEVPALVGRRKAQSRGPQVVAIQGRIVCHL
jgi:hypothetical protein